MFFGGQGNVLVAGVPVGEIGQLGRQVGDARDELVVQGPLERKIQDADPRGTDRPHEQVDRGPQKDDELIGGQQGDRGLHLR